MYLHQVLASSYDCYLFANLALGFFEPPQQDRAGVPLCLQYPQFIASANTADIIHKGSQGGGA
eukprot:11980479-Karenia_brevis.AAC.1